MHNNNVIEQNINVSMFDILSIKNPDSRYNSTKKSGQLYPIFKFCQPKQDNISLS